MLPMFFVPVAKLHIKTEETVSVSSLFNLTGFLTTTTTVLSINEQPIEEEGTTVLSKEEQTDRNIQWSIMLFGILICALNLIIIFLYKRRLLQLRLCIYNIMFLVGITGIIFFIAYNIPNIQSVSFRLPIVFPLISIILHYLAFRGIRKDEIMVQALSRLR